jgi:hypothetical protein
VDSRSCGLPDGIQRWDKPPFPVLYHIREDAAELKNLSQEFSEIVISIKLLANELMQEIDTIKKLKIVTSK